MEDRFRQAEGQMDLFPAADEPPRWYRLLAYAIVGLLALGLLALPAMAGEIKTHACKSPQVAQELTDFIAENGINDYPKVANPYLKDGQCVFTTLEGPPPADIPPVYATSNGDFHIAIYMVFDGARPYFAILMNDIRKHPKFAQAI